MEQFGHITSVYEEVTENGLDTMGRHLRFCFNQMLHYCLIKANKAGDRENQLELDKMIL